MINNTHEVTTHSCDRAETKFSGYLRPRRLGSDMLAAEQRRAKQRESDILDSCTRQNKASQHASVTHKSCTGQQRAS
eukprot:342411-Amphidinium_carterae.1